MDERAQNICFRRSHWSDVLDYARKVDVRVDVDGNIWLNDIVSIDLDTKIDIGNSDHKRVLIVIRFDELDLEYKADFFRSEDLTYSNEVTVGYLLPMLFESSLGQEELKMALYDRALDERKKEIFILRRIKEKECGHTTGYIKKMLLPEDIWKSIDTEFFMKYILNDES